MPGPEGGGGKGGIGVFVDAVDASCRSVAAVVGAAVCRWPCFLMRELFVFLISVRVVRVRRIIIFRTLCVS